LKNLKIKSLQVCKKEIYLTVQAYPVNLVNMNLVPKPKACPYQVNAKLFKKKFKVQLMETV